MFKTLGKTIGNVIAAVFFIFLGIMVVGMNNSDDFEKENIDGVRSFLDSLVVNWDREDIKEYLHPELYQIMNSENSKELIEYYSRLGEIHKIDSISMTDYKKQTDGSELGAFSGVASFENSKADITVVLTKVGEKPFVTKFVVLPHKELEAITDNSAI